MGIINLSKMIMIPKKTGEICYNDFSGYIGYECKVLITKTDQFNFFLQCDDMNIEEEFSSEDEMINFCNLKYGCSVGSFCCDG